MESSWLAKLETSKPTWPQGPWHSEPDKEYFDVGVVEFQGLAVRHPTGGHWCGYVGIPSSHPLYGKSYVEYEALGSVHGGITYSEHCNGVVCHIPKPGQAKEMFWIGFDCAHYGDVSPGSLWRGEEEFAHYWTLDEVKAECKKLAEALILGANK